jgi:uncharacterized protein (TIGR04255 family)
MSTTWQADSLLLMPSPAGLGQYKRNYLQQTVCELRFPTLLPLGDAKPPSAFAHALRKAYPTYNQLSEVTVGLGSQTHTPNLSHQFKSSNGLWSVTLKNNALVLEGSRYSSYADLRARLELALAAALPVIDTDFFTRIGLRYINVLKTNGTRIVDWVNSDLVAPLSKSSFVGMADYGGRLQVVAPDGGLLLQHGLSHKPGREASGATAEVPDYVIDIDGFRSEVAAADVVVAVDRVHEQVFQLFDWAIGPKAREYLSSS